MTQRGVPVGARTERRTVSACPICGGTALAEADVLRDHDTAEPFRALRCEDCWTTFLADPPVDAELGLYYEPHGEMSDPGALFARLRSLKIAREIRPVARLLPPGARVLDYGCGDGSMAAAFVAAGFSAVAADTYDPSDWHRDGIPYARSVPGTPFGDLLDAHGPFDAAVFRHVLEHLPDPVGVLRSLHDRGTRVVGLVVPNALAPSARLLGERWFYWDPPRHLYGFSPQSVNAMAAASGFRVADLRVAGLDSLVTSVHRGVALGAGGALEAHGWRRTALRVTRPTGLLAAAASAAVAPVGSSILVAELVRRDED
ncbi:MAG: class I SAM-dependent methyltransferase [Microthrixaceae bacterium]